MVNIFFGLHNVSEWLKFGRDIYTSFINMCRKLKVFLLSEKKAAAVYVTCFGFSTISGKCVRTRKTVFCRVKNRFLLLVHVIIQLSSQQVWERNFHA